MANVLKRDTFLKEKCGDYAKRKRACFPGRPYRSVSPGWLLATLPLYYFLPFGFAVFITLLVLSLIMSSRRPNDITPQEIDEASSLREESVQWFRGLRGEAYVERVLDELPDNCFVIHDVIISGHQIDHVVVSENGIFAIETKSYRGNYFSTGEYWVQGKTQIKSPQYQAAACAAALSDLLGTGVTPVVALMTTANFSGPGPCRVLYAYELCRFITSHPPCISGPEELARQILAASQRQEKQENKQDTLTGNFLLSR